MRLRPTDQIVRDVLDGGIGIEVSFPNIQNVETEENLPLEPEEASNIISRNWNSDEDETPVQQQASQNQKVNAEFSSLEKRERSNVEGAHIQQQSDMPPIRTMPARMAVEPVTSEHSNTTEEPPHAEESTVAEVQGLETQQIRRSGHQRRPPSRLNLMNNKDECVALHGLDLESQEQAVIAQICKKHGTDQFTKNKGPDVPEWMYTKAIELEMENWKGHYKRTIVMEVPPGANMVGSHFIYRVKRNDDGSFKFKARLVVHGNEDIEKDEIRKDSATAHLTAIRMILSIAACYRFKIGKIDIKAAYFQSGSIKRKIYVRPPRELLLYQTVWQLLCLPYGIVEAGRQWQLVSDDFLKSIGMQAIYALPQCFIVKNNGEWQLIVGKIVDDFLLAGTPRMLSWFSKKIRGRFQVGAEAFAPDQIRFDGLLLKQARDGSIRASMEEFANSIKPIELSPARRKKNEEPVSKSELKMYQSLAGKMN